AFALFVGLRRARWARMEKPRGASLPWITGFCTVRGLTPRALGADGETARSVITVDYRLLRCSWAYAAHGCAGGRADWKSYAALFALAKAAMGAFRAGTPHACRNLVVTKCAAM
ncbi:MAG: hypothetical protein MR400_09955, partial [Clostridiales bacterium]|nr:hypothetical protein [Clostridiales bacterium]